MEWLISFCLWVFILFRNKLRFSDSMYTHWTFWSIIFCFRSAMQCCDSFLKLFNYNLFIILLWFRTFSKNMHCVVKWFWVYFNNLSNLIYLLLGIICIFKGILFILLLQSWIKKLCVIRFNYRANFMWSNFFFNNSCW